MTFMQVLIEVVGWIYFAAWSLSFYGQLVLNYRLKFLQGMNLDYLILNATGFTFLSIYSSYGYFVDPSVTGTVLINDLLFAYHALLITLLTVLQALYYPYLNDQLGKNKVSTWFIVLFAIYWLLVGVMSYSQYVSAWWQPEPRLDTLAFMGYFKISISVIKYIPQIFWNWRRKSTEGWSIVNILLDLTGGLFSFLQQVLQKIEGDPNPINIVKVALGVLSISYDIVFIIQHYCLYPERKRDVQILSEVDN